MKKFSIKMVPTATLILFIVALMFAFWAGAQKDIAESGNFIDDAVLVHGGVANSTNEGKYVCAPGKLTVKKAPFDPLTGISANGVVLVRDVQMYQYYIQNDTVYKGFSSEQEKNIVGKGSENYVNPVFPKEYSKAVFTGEVTLNGGDLHVGARYLNELTLPTNMTEKTFEKVDVDLSNYADRLPGFKLYDGYYYSGDPNNLKIGDLKIKYYYIPAEKVGEVTVFGPQKNSVIEGDDNGHSYIVGSATDLDGLKDILYKTYEDTAAGLTFVAVACAVAGAVVLVIRIKKIKEEEGSEV